MKTAPLLPHRFLAGFAFVAILAAPPTRAESAHQAWVQRYNGPGNTNDYGSAVAVDGSGNVVVTGYSTGNGSNYDYYTAKYAAADGSLIWEKRYNGTGNSDDQAKAVAVDGSGNVIVTGYSTGSSGNRNFYTAKYAGRMAVCSGRGATADW